MKKVIGIGLALFVFILLAGSNSTEAAVNTSSCVIITQELALNSQGSQVEALQRFLNFTATPFNGQSGYGFFGANTEGLVKKFQEDQGLTVNGKVDAATAAKIKQLTCVSATAATKASMSSDPWYNANCLPEATMGIYGVQTPVLYFSGGLPGQGGILQLTKPFTVTVNGSASTTIGGKLSFSDPSNLSVSPESCTTGFASMSQVCTITPTGQVREIWVKESNPGKTPYPVCAKVTINRAPQAYQLSLDIDKATFGSNEAFKVTMHGISRGKAADAFPLFGMLKFERDGAPYTSCESSVASNICQGDSILSCALAQTTTSNESDAEYICAANYLDTSGSFRYPNRNSNVTYRISMGNTSDLFDTYTFTGGKKPIVLLKDGTSGSDTNYGNCPSGQGTNPASPQAGCTRCLNIPSKYRTHIISCKSVSGDIYKWEAAGTAFGFDMTAPADALCAKPDPSGELCPEEGVTCFASFPLKENTTKKYVCKNTNLAVSNAVYHGKVFKASDGTPLAGVTVKPFHVTASWLGVTCPTATTTSDGEYVFDGDKSKSLCFMVGANVDFTKTGYDPNRIAVGNEYDKSIASVSLPAAGTSVGANGAIQLTPSSATLNRSEGSRVVFTLLNGLQALNYGGLDVCYEVVKRARDAFTPTAIDKPANPSSCNWINSWSKNNDWAPNGANLVWEINYIPSVWNIPGLQVLIAFRKHNTTDVTYAVLSTEGPKAGEAAASAPASAYDPGNGQASNNNNTPAANSNTTNNVVANTVNAIVDTVANVVNTVVNTVSNWLGGRNATMDQY